MLDQSFEKLYLLFRANYYKRMVQAIGTRKGSLSATECFCVEIIHLLEKPTLSEFAAYLGISVPNATYKVNSLVEKGYVTRAPSAQDRRESHLAVTDKFLGYYGLRNENIGGLIDRIQEDFTPGEVQALEGYINRIVGFMQEGEAT